MSDVIKAVNRAVPVLQRSQNFTNADAAQGDVLKVADSLGYPASHVTIEATGGALKVCFNVWQTVFNNYGDQSRGYLYGTDHLPNVTSGHSFMINTQSGVGANPAGAVTIEAGETYTIDRVLAVSDIQLVIVSGNFDVWVA